MLFFCDCPSISIFCPAQIPRKPTWGSFPFWLLVCQAHGDSNRTREWKGIAGVSPLRLPCHISDYIPLTMVRSHWLSLDKQPALHLTHHPTHGHSPL